MVSDQPRMPILTTAAKTAAVTFADHRYPDAAAALGSVARTGSAAPGRS